MPNAAGDYLGILRRRRNYLITIIPAALLLAVYLAYALPPSYRSSATILLEASSIPPELVQVTPTSYADEQIELVSRRVLTTERLEKVVQELDPYPDRPELSTKEKAVQVVADTIIERVDPITLEVLKQSSAFSIHYHNADPRRAQQVVKRIADLFLEYNRATRAERASETYNFLLEQANGLDQQIRDVEQRIAQFKQRHGEALPEGQTVRQAQAERAQRELEDVEARIRDSEERQSQLSLQLSKINPSLSTTAGNWRTELSTLQGQLADARMRYTQDHPDVKRLQRAIAELAVKGGTSDSAMASSADTPDYQRVASQLQSARRELGVLRASEGRIRSELYGYEQNLATAPNVERDYVALSRQYEAMQAQYNDLQQKIKTASLSESLESQSKGERFEIIRDVSVPGSPYSPNRFGIVLVALLIGVALSLLVAVIRDSSDPTVRSQRDIEAVFGSDPIAMIPVLRSHADLEDRRRRIGKFAAAYAAAAAVAAVTVLLVRH